MAYSFRPAHESAESGLRRIAASQIDKAIAEIDGDGLQRDEAVHQVRKRTKKLRALLRLVRPGFEDFARENRTFRDAARAIAGPRDAAALVETFDRLAEYFELEIDASAFAGLRRRLVERRDALDDTSLAQRLPDVREVFVAARRRAAKWALTGDRDGDVFDAFASGLRRTYRDAIAAMEAADRERSSRALHEWRKRVKDHASHARLLKGAWEPVLGAHAVEAVALAEDLGEVHDLIVFREALTSDELDGDRACEAMRGLAVEREGAIASQAFARGGRVFAERPAALARRWRAYWRD